MLPGDGVVDQFRLLSAIWGQNLFADATWLFQQLAIIEFALAAIFWTIQNQGFETLTSGLLKKMVAIGAMYSILLNYQVWLPAIVQAFMQAGQHATGLENLGPSEVFMQGLSVALEMMLNMKGWGILVNPIGTFCGLIVVVIVIISFGAIAVQMGLMLCKAYIFTGAGVLLLGFAPFRGTSSISERYLSGIVTTGIQLFVLYIVVGAGSVLAPQWGELINETTILNLRVPFTVAFAAAMFATIAWHIPKVAGELAGGAVTMGLGEVLSASYAATGMGKTAIGAGMAAGGGAIKLGGAALGSLRGGSPLSTVSIGSGANNGSVPKLNSTPAP